MKKPDLVKKKKKTQHKTLAKSLSQLKIYKTFFFKAKH